MVKIKFELSDNDKDIDSATTMTIALWMYLQSKATTSRIFALGTKRFNLDQTICIHAHRFVNQVPKTLSFNPLVLGLMGHIYATL